MGTTSTKSKTAKAAKSKKAAALKTGKGVTAQPKQAAKKAQPQKPEQPNPGKTSRQPTPWLKLKGMWESGASYEAMARATDPHLNPASSDPTKPTRAKICRARKQGVRINGCLVRFGVRGKVKEVEKKGNGKTVKSTKPVQPKKAVQKADKATGKAAKAVQKPVKREHGAVRSDGQPQKPVPAQAAQNPNMKQTETTTTDGTETATLPHPGM